MTMVAPGDDCLAQITGGVAPAVEPWFAAQLRRTRFTTAQLNFEVAAGARSPLHNMRSGEHCSVDGTPVQAETGQKRFEPNDDDQAPGDANCNDPCLVEDLITASCSITRSRRLLNTVDTESASSITSQLNERNSKVYCVEYVS